MFYFDINFFIIFVTPFSHIFTYLFPSHFCQVWCGGSHRRHHLRGSQRGLLSPPGARLQRSQRFNQSAEDAARLGGHRSGLECHLPIQVTIWLFQ